jgi:hypothetical protein
LFATAAFNALIRVESNPRRVVVQDLLKSAPKETVGLFMRQAYVKTTQGQSFFVDIDVPPFVTISSKAQTPTPA